jgi:regulatory protein
VLGTDDRLQRALELAYGYLSSRDRTRAEVRRRLERDRLEPSAIEGAIRTLVDQGYVDDARFARLFAEDKRELEHWGSDRIRRTLLERGIDRELVERTLRAEPAETELDRALALLRRRFPAPPGDRRERDRAIGVMLRKGYDSELALDALAAYARDAQERELR